MEASPSALYCSQILKQGLSESSYARSHLISSATFWTMLENTPESSKAASKMSSAFILHLVGFALGPELSDPEVYQLQLSVQVKFRGLSRVRQDKSCLVEY